MTVIKNRSKIVSVVLAVVMVFATAAVSFAGEAEQPETVTKSYNVKICKQGTQTPSTISKIIAPGTFAKATTNQDGSVKVEIPIVPIYNYTAMGVFTADVYLSSITVKNTAQSGNISPSVTPYTSAVMTISAPSMPESLKFEVSKAKIDLYNPGTNTPYWLAPIRPAFDIILTEV